MKKVLSCSVDDDLRWLRERILVGAGCKVISSTDRREALQLLSSETFDVLLLGHSLSATSMDELCSAFRKSSLHGRIVAVAGSGEPPRGNVDEVVHGLEGPEALIKAVLQEHSAPGILVVDDQPVARTAIRTLLRAHSMKVSGEAEDGKEAIDKVKELRPQVVLLDIKMPGMDGIQTAYEIRRISPATKIVFITLYDSRSFIEQAKVLGHGFVSKSSAGTELIPTLQRLLAPSERTE
jgi:DNA-binding NarL/FixJ family response regulator